MSDQFLGVDLAWSQRARTGLAVVDESGRLVSSHAAVTDGDIDRWIAQNAPHARVIAVDAPLVVHNPTGQRVCENLIGKAFGRYNASAHVSNQTKSYFNPPRGLALSERHGWEIDPEYAGAQPICLEVGSAARIGDIAFEDSAVLTAMNPRLLTSPVFNGNQPPCTLS
jgi:predicted RNase H-like nuclease